MVIHQYDHGDSSSPKRFRTFIFMNMRMKPVISILFYERDHWFKSFHVIRYSLSYKLMVLKITFSCLFVKSPVFILVIHKPLESLCKTDKRLFDQLSLSIFLVLVLMRIIVQMVGRYKLSGVSILFGRMPWLEDIDFRIPLLRSHRSCLRRRKLNPKCCP